MKQHATMLIAVTALLVLAGAWFLLNYERRSEPEYRPMADEARRNPFLAAERLLQGFGVEVRHRHGLEGELALPADAVLIVPAGRGVLSEAALARLQDWVGRGGHLLVEMEADERDDLLLDRFGIGRQPLDEDARGYGFRFAQAQTVPMRPLIHDGIAQAMLPHSFATGSRFGEPRLRLLMRSRQALASGEAPRWTIGDADGARALQLAVGRGRVTAAVDLNPLRNCCIGQADHAEWLHRLLLQDGAPATNVAIVQGWHGGLWAWLLETGWRVLPIAGVLLAAWLWSVMPRFGPPVADPSPQRRRLLDHLAAAGRLLWARDQRAVLAQAATAAAIGRLRAEYPHTASLGPAELALFLRRRFGFDALQAQALLAAPATQPAAFVHQVRACRLLQRALLAPPRRGRAALFDDRPE